MRIEWGLGNGIDVFDHLRIARHTTKRQDGMQVVEMRLGIAWEFTFTRDTQLLHFSVTIALVHTATDVV